MNAKSQITLFYENGKGVQINLVLTREEFEAESLASQHEIRDMRLEDADDGSYTYITRAGLLFYKFREVSETNIITRPGLVKP